MIIMGLDNLYLEALQFLNTIDFTRSDQLSKGFETNIRYLGGLLSAYDLRGDRVLINKAVELADHVLMPLFDSPSGAPYTNFDFNTGKPEPTSTILLAEFGSYSMEFTRLSQITGDKKYAETANSVVDKVIAKPSRMPGLYPNSWKLDPFEPINDSIVDVGMGGDSYYEYLIKNHVLLGGSKENLLNSWIEAVDSIQKYLLSPTAEDPSIQFVATSTNGTVGYRSDELICFWPGNVLLGISQMDSGRDKNKYFKFAKTFMDSCIKTWTTTATGLGPEFWTWKPEEAATKKGSPTIRGSIKNVFGDNSHKEQKREEESTLLGKRAGNLDVKPYTIDSPAYNLRPETIESVFYFTRVDTQNSNYYKNIGWDMFQAIDKYTKVKAGYSSISNVDDPAISVMLDFEESFFFTETLKYLYLMFTDESCMSLDEFVFTTEAHPLKAPKAIRLQNTF
ncbi:glycoside hydrolase [Zychaea mexicana]|uniref:glycoside hydrolase n=1 Tax=Zychaea mexicana TaxID=64656 RepID=UPI0022FECA43|nr:glycoside hydrolase [Zychaea mexicana]KAI9490284.1 glycoside hydrolase [Zychaea mexicana]